MLRTRALLSSFPLLLVSMNPVQLACIRPAASVHPEPGSNSPLLESFKLALVLFSS